MENLIREDKEYLLNVYKRMDLIISKGKGCYLYDNNGKKYLDMFSGIAVNNFGHTNKQIISKINEQANNFIHLSNYFVSKPIVNLAKLLVDNSFASKVFFTNSGTETIEATIKLVRKYGKSFSADKYRILSAYNSFHGRTCGGLSLTGQDKYKKDFSPLLPGVEHFNFNDINDLKSKVNKEVCAVYIEIIQGEGGIKETSKEFIDELVKLSKEYNFLIVVDEIQTGLARTGKLFAYEHLNFKPDILALAKSLGGGLPIGAMLVSKDLENIFTYGDHGSTFGGNPVAASVGEFIVENISNSNFIKEINYKSDKLLSNLNSLKEKYPNIIKDVRGKGLMIGVDVGEYSSEIKKQALNNNLLLNVTNNTIIRLLPPLTITEDEIKEFLNIFETVLNSI
ncbi:MAG: acetylornithine/succinylornithine family transaminase [Firmicutes bacterium]|nr:acetylornithine/succinylornithine family transaminase [Bacillota bacterium]